MNPVAANLNAVLEYVRLVNLLGDIPGSANPLEAHTLMLLARHGPGKGLVAEVGCALGRATAWMAWGCKQAGRGKVVAMDTFQGPYAVDSASGRKETLSGTAAQERLAATLEAKELADHVVVKAVASQKAAPRFKQPLRMLCLDADPAPEAVRADFDAWTPHVVPGGLVCLMGVGHWEGVTAFYEELMGSQRGYTELCAVFHLRCLQKPEE